MACMPFEVLLAFVRGEASEKSREEIAAHLSSGCRNCSEAETWIRETLEVAEADESFDIAADLIQWSVSHFKAHPPSRAVSVREIIGRLIFDSLSSPEFAGVRSERSSPSPGRQMLYRAEGYDVDVRVEPEAPQLDAVIGQVLPAGGRKDDSLEMEVRLVCEGEEIAVTRTDAQGIFRFGRVRAGSYDLRVAVPEGILWIPYVAQPHRS